MREIRDVDIELLYQHAEEFRWAAELLASETWTRLRHSGGHLSSASPVLVMGALATELYFKCLLLVDPGSYPATHELDELFAALPEEARVAVRARYKPRESLDHMRYDTLLYYGAKTFTTFRYLPEGYGKPRDRDRGGFMLDMMDPPREHLLELRPDLRE